MECGTVDSYGHRIEELNREDMYRFDDFRNKAIHTQPAVFEQQYTLY
jgi:hypothetical protein